MQNNVKKNQKGTSLKKNSTSEFILETSYTQVSKHRQESGQTFETEMTNRLLAKGIVTKKLAANVSRGLKKIADNYFEGKKNYYWIESTTCITNMARVDEFIKKKHEVSKTNPHINKWAIFYRKEDRQTPQSPTTIRNYRKYLADEGIELCFGDDEINEYINGIVTTEEVKLSSIPVARAEMIPLSKIFQNINNRANIRKSVTTLTAGIIQQGFISLLTVVPESINGVLTGNFILIDADNRRTSLFEVMKLGHSFETGDDPLIGCAIIDWMTSEDPRCNDLIIDTNTKSHPWKMTDYIDFHEKTSAENIKVERKKNFSYKVLQFLRSDKARMTEILKDHKTGEFEKIPETYLIYVFGPRKHGNTLYRGLDTEQINSGDYRESQSNFESMKFFLNNVFHPFYCWFKTEFGNTRDKMIPRRFMGGLFQRYLESKDLNETLAIVEVFKNLGDNFPHLESDVNQGLWNIIEAELARNQVKAKSSTRTRRVPQL